MSLPNIGQSCEPGNVAAKASTDALSGLKRRWPLAPQLLLATCLKLPLSNPTDRILLVENLDTVFFYITGPIGIRNFKDTIVVVKLSGGKFRETNWLGMTSAWNQQPAQQSLPQFTNFTITTAAGATTITLSPQLITASTSFSTYIEDCNVYI
ncbi:uncharacterized protein DFL_004318 [Arthrobotrys flagrans]|uniref:Uncharacterized protein n=1 Tax=Arthrobotrys flagrans TaxID=97331 RepID=A0A437A4B6_ARTFL|nr:hypothetical protein DFL_004318 [Arthrobotrys flagrans]